MIRIIETTAHGETVESRLATIEAANNRLRMLRKHNPHNAYWISQPKPRVTVTPIPANDPYTARYVRNAK